MANTNNLPKEVLREIKAHINILVNHGYENDGDIDMEKDYIKGVKHLEQMGINHFENGFVQMLDDLGDRVYIYFLWNNNLQKSDLRNLEEVSNSSFDAKIRNRSKHILFKSENCAICKYVVREDMEVFLRGLVGGIRRNASESEN